jgi:hypothetical protein
VLVLLGVDALASALLGLLMWWWSGWTVGWRSATAIFAAACIMTIHALQPRRSRRYRWGAPALWVLWLAAGVALVAGLPNRRYVDLGVVVLVRVASALLARYRSAVDRVMTILFGGPYPDPGTLRPKRLPPDD